jgi:hypothetical protein
LFSFSEEEDVEAAGVQEAVAPKATLVVWGGTSTLMLLHPTALQAITILSCGLAAAFLGKMCGPLEGLSGGKFPEEQIGTDFCGATCSRTLISTEAEVFNCCFLPFGLGLLPHRRSIYRISKRKGFLCSRRTMQPANAIIFLE